MRRPGLLLATLLLALALPAHAQDDDEDRPAPPRPGAPPHAQDKADAEPEDQGDTGPACPPPADLKPELAPAYTAACTFFSAVAHRSPQDVAALVRSPFYFEGHAVNGLEEVRRRWTQHLADLRGQSSVFYGLELLSYDDMLKKYGKPPPKLESVPLKGATLAVGNVDGHAAVIALKRDGATWTVFAFHD